MKKLIQCSLLAFLVSLGTGCKTNYKPDPRYAEAINHRGSTLGVEDINGHCERTAKSFYLMKLGQLKDPAAALSATHYYINVSYRLHDVSACRQSLDKIGTASAIGSIFGIFG